MRTQTQEDTVKFPEMQIKGLIKLFFFLPDLEIQVKPDSTSCILSTVLWTTHQQAHGITSLSHPLSFLQTILMIKEGKEKEEQSIWARPIFYFMIQSKLPPLPVLPPPEGFAKQVHHVKSAWREWQGLQPSVQKDTAGGPDKHTCQGNSCFSLPIAQSQNRSSLPKAMILHVIREFPLFSFRIF